MLLNFYSSLFLLKVNPTVNRATIIFNFMSTDAILMINDIRKLLIIICTSIIVDHCINFNNVTSYDAKSV